MVAKVSQGPPIPWFSHIPDLWAICIHCFMQKGCVQNGLFFLKPTPSLEALALGKQMLLHALQSACPKSENMESNEFGGQLSHSQSLDVNIQSRVRRFWFWFFFPCFVMQNYCQHHLASKVSWDDGDRGAKPSEICPRVSYCHPNFCLYCLEYRICCVFYWRCYLVFPALSYTWVNESWRWQ